MTEETPPQRPAYRPTRRTVAIGAIGFATVMGMIGLVALGDPAPPASRFVAVADDEVAATSPRTDPLMAELLRCRSLPAGSDDAACREAWEVNRRRFMGESRSYAAPGFATPAPAQAAAPATER